MDCSLLESNEKELFNRIASNYIEKDIFPTSRYARKFQLFSLFNLCFSFFQKDKLKSIIELGCGSGYATQYLHGHFDKYLGVDFSEEFIVYARNHFEKEHVNFLCGNINEISINNLKVEFVFGIGVLHHLQDINRSLEQIKVLGNSSTLFGFIEPQASNPIIKFLRLIRKKVDENYSAKQVYFTKKDIKVIFNKHGFDIKKIKYIGYFSTPFAQVIIKPDWLFLPILKFLVRIDQFIETYFNNILSWNICWIAQKKADTTE